MANYSVTLPQLHQGQQFIYDRRGRRNAVRMGRRYGKTKFLVYLASEGGLEGKSVGIFTAEYRQQAEIWSELLEVLDSIKRSANKNDGTIKLITGGKIDFWTLNDNELAGRGREYDIVLIDEAAFTKNGQMLDIWFKAINPTMLTTRGEAWIFSTPNGLDPDNFFFAVCNDDSMGFKEFHAPTSGNPYVPLDELEKEKERNHPLVFRQEFLAEFVDWSGVAFFDPGKMLLDGAPLPLPEKCDGVFAVIDTAVKGGKEHDGTAVTYFAVNKYFGAPLVILDWDIVQIDGAMLEHWMPSVFSRIDEFVKLTNARHGSIGAFVEDAAAGAILIQQGRNKGWPIHSIDSKLTSMGKDERAISVSGYFHQEKVKIYEMAYDKVMKFKGTSRNHLLAQVAQFRIGDKDASTRSDDLLDTFVYGIAIGLGNSRGF